MVQILQQSMHKINQFCYTTGRHWKSVWLQTSVHQ